MMSSYGIPRCLSAWTLEPSLFILMPDFIVRRIDHDGEMRLARGGRRACYSEPGAVPSDGGCTLPRTGSDEEGPFSQKSR